MGAYFTIKWVDGVVRMLDQRRLPHETVYLDFTDHQGIATAIREMVIRGAPAIGGAGAYGMALAVTNTRAKDVEELRAELAQAAQMLGASRPTAVNLFWAIERIQARAAQPDLDTVVSIQEAVLIEAHKIAAEDVQINRLMGMNALPLIPDEANIIHHCNTGALATVDYGTALGAIRTAHEQGKRIHVYVDETRPRLQGARLTSWELKQLGIPHTVIVDGASGYIMRAVGIHLCLVGCDRIAANGDVANKIGTYNLALVAYAHKVPFFSVGPTSTIDMNASCGDEIPIEERPTEEMTHIGDYQITPDGVRVANPAFDVTPAKYVTGIITERGIAYPPYEESLTKLIER